jgi:hypothetical protein
LQHRPEVDIAQELEDLERRPLQDSIKEKLGPVIEPSKATPDIGDVDSDDDYDSSDNENVIVDITNQMPDLNSDRQQIQFYGKSSMVGLFRTLLDVKSVDLGATNLEGSKIFCPSNRSFDYDQVGFVSYCGSVHVQTNLLCLVTEPERHSKFPAKLPVS